MQNPRARAVVPVELTWNLDDLFASVADWEAEAEALDAARAELHPYQGQLGESAGTLLACLDRVEMLEQRLMRVGAFGHLLNAQDGTNPQYQAAMARVDALEARWLASTAFVDAEILELPDGTVERFLAQESTLAAHQVHLQDLLDTRPHRLSADAQRVLASLGELLDAPWTIYQRSKAGGLTGGQLSSTATTGSDAVNSKMEAPAFLLPSLQLPAGAGDPCGSLRSGVYACFR
jgi:oligoendopeptidase F